MCLVVLAWQAHPRYRLIAAANRDEFHARPAAPLGWWHEHPQLLAGRDLEANGTWMGAARSGRFGMLTNFRELAPRPDMAPSRGNLIPEFLDDSAPAAEFLHTLDGRASQYAGFNLLLGDATSLWYFSNRDADSPRQLAAGLHMLSNHRLGTPWPKARRSRDRLHALMQSEQVDTDALLELLADRRPAEDHEMPSTGLPLEWERALSAPFVLHPEYGTRCSTVLLVETDGRTVSLERRFDPAGAETGRTRFEFSMGEPAGAAFSAPRTADTRRPAAKGDDWPE